MDIRIITEHDVEEFIRLRLEALTCEPMPLDAHWRMSARGPLRVWPRLRAVPEGNFVVGAFEGGHMVGQALSGTKGAKSATKGLSGAYT